MAVGERGGDGSPGLPPPGVLDHRHRLRRPVESIDFRTGLNQEKRRLYVGCILPFTGHHRRGLAVLPGVPEYRPGQVAGLDQIAQPRREGVVVVHGVSVHPDGDLPEVGHGGQAKGLDPRGPDLGHGHAEAEPGQRQPAAAEHRVGREQPRPGERAQRAAVIARLIDPRHRRGRREMRFELAERRQQPRDVERQAVPGPHGQQPDQGLVQRQHLPGRRPGVAVADGRGRRRRAEPIQQSLNRVGAVGQQILLRLGQVPADRGRDIRGEPDHQPTVHHRPSWRNERQHQAPLGETVPLLGEQLQRHVFFAEAGVELLGHRVERPLDAGRVVYRQHQAEPGPECAAEVGVGVERPPVVGEVQQLVVEVEAERRGKLPFKFGDALSGPRVDLAEGVGCRVPRRGGVETLHPKPCGRGRDIGEVGILE